MDVLELFELLLKKLPIFEDEFEGFFELRVLFFFVDVLLLELFGLLPELVVFLFQLVTILNFSFKLLICLSELELDEVNFFLAFLEVGLYVLRIGYFIVEREDRVVYRVVIVLHGVIIKFE